jgi:hypothetical protein
MGLFISGIAGSVKTLEGNEGGLRVRYERLLSAPWWWGVTAQKTERMSLSKQSNTLVEERHAVLFATSYGVVVLDSSPDHAIYRATDPGLPEPQS